jgi:hypothetical protein
MDFNFDRKLLLTRGGAVLAGLLGLAVLLPVLWFALLSSLSLLGLGIVGIIGVGIFTALPMLGQRFENKLLQMRKQEARRNPIEQLQSRLILEGQKITTLEKALGTINGFIATMARMLDEEKRSDPDHDLSVSEKSLIAMRRFYDTHVEKLKAAQTAMNNFAKEIKRKEFEFKFSQVGQAALASVNSTDRDITQKLLTDEAFKEVEEQFDKVFGALEVQTVLDQVKTLESSQTLVQVDPSPRQLGA